MPPFSLIFINMDWIGVAGTKRAAVAARVVSDIHFILFIIIPEG